MVDYLKVYTTHFVEAEQGSEDTKLKELLVKMADKWEVHSVAPFNYMGTTTGFVVVLVSKL